MSLLVVGQRAERVDAFGLCLYYPGRRNIPASPRAFIDVIREIEPPVDEIRDLGTEVEVSEGVKQGDKVSSLRPSTSRTAVKY
jgi:hypothetical protein